MKVLKQNVIYVSFFNNILKKIFFLFVTLFSLTISDRFYAQVILLFILSNYVYEIVSLSIPKVFNNYLKIYNSKKLSILSGFNLYLSSLMIFIILLLSCFFNNFEINNSVFSDNYFILGFVLLGFSVALNDLIDKYNYLKFNHLYIYYYDILEIIISSLAILLIFFGYTGLIEEQVFLIIFVFSIVKFIFSVIKLIIFRKDIELNFKQILTIINFEDFKNLTKLVIPIFLISILFLLQFTISRFIILYIEDYSTFSIFAFHNQIIELCSLFFLSLHQLSGPKISYLFRNKKKKMLLILQNKLLAISYTVTPVLLFTLYFLANDIINILDLNISFNNFLFIILSFNFFVIYLFLTMYQHMIMQNETKFLLVIMFITILMNFFLSLTLTYFYSLIGLALANLVSNIFLLLICNNRTNFFFFRKSEKKSLVLLIFRISIIIYISNIWDFTSISESDIKIFIVKLTLILVLFIGSEMLMSKKYRIYFLFDKLIKTINYR